MLDEAERAILQLWIAFRGTEMGAGHLPFSGGFAEQPAGLIACFNEMSAAAALINDRMPRR